MAKNTAIALYADQTHWSESVVQHHVNTIRPRIDPSTRELLGIQLCLNSLHLHAVDSVRYLFWTPSPAVLHASAKTIFYEFETLLCTDNRLFKTGISGSRQRFLLDLFSANFRPPASSLQSSDSYRPERLKSSDTHEVSQPAVTFLNCCSSCSEGTVTHSEESTICPHAHNWLALLCDQVCHLSQPMLSWTNCGVVKIRTPNVGASS